MNVESIKRSGFELGLQAELAVQQSNLISYNKDKRWSNARQCALNCVDLLDELMKLKSSSVSSKESEKTN